MREKYKAARLVLTLITLAGYICAAGGVMMIVQNGLEVGLASSIPLFFGGLILIAIAQFASATIDTAQNTAAMLEIMKQGATTRHTQSPANPASSSDTLTRLSSAGYQSRDK